MSGEELYNKLCGNYPPNFLHVAWHSLNDVDRAAWEKTADQLADLIAEARIEGQDL